MSEIKKITLNEKRDVTLTSYIIDDKTRPAIVILPGGAYTDCSAQGERPLAEIYNSYGFNTFVLGYSVGKNYKWPLPLEDYDSAIDYIKEHNDEYHIDLAHISALGLSAGAHLASVCASIARNKPFAAILSYPVTIKHDIEYTAPGAVDSNELVDENTCPCFLFATRNDWIAPVRNTLKFFDKLNENFIDYECHILGYGMHGYSFGKGAENQKDLYCSRVEDWVGESAAWLDELISGRYVSIRNNPPYHDSKDNHLSVKNSCGLIFKNEEAVKVLSEKYPQLLFVYKTIKDQVGEFVDTVNVEMALGFISATTGMSFDVKSIDDCLNTIVIKRP